MGEAQGVGEGRGQEEMRVQWLAGSMSGDMRQRSLDFNL